MPTAPLLTDAGRRRASTSTPGGTVGLICTARRGSSGRALRTAERSQLPADGITANAGSPITNSLAGLSLLGSRKPYLRWSGRVDQPDFLAAGPQGSWIPHAGA